MSEITEVSTYTYSDQPLNKCALRILDISYKHKLGHIGSCLTALPIIYDIYLTKQSQDKVILSAGHSGLALYVVLEYFGIIKDAEKVLVRDGIHPVRGLGIDASTGSLGQGITLGVGMALSNPDMDVHVISTDGEVAEGSFWESIYFAFRKGLGNLIVYVNDNGYSALSQTRYLNDVLESFNVNLIDTSGELPRLSWLAGLKAHYQAMNEQQYKEISKFYGRY